LESHYRLYPSKMDGGTSTSRLDLQGIVLASCRACRSNKRDGPGLDHNDYCLWMFASSGSRNGKRSISFCGRTWFEQGIAAATRCKWVSNFSFRCLEIGVEGRPQQYWSQSQYPLHDTAPYPLRRGRAPAQTPQTTHWLDKGIAVAQLLWAWRYLGTTITCSPWQIPTGFITTANA
jgi:hypothetical protein